MLCFLVYFMVMSVFMVLLDWLIDMMRVLVLIIGLW